LLPYNQKTIIHFEIRSARLVGGRSCSLIQCSSLAVASVGEGPVAKVLVIGFLDVQAEPMFGALPRRSQRPVGGNVLGSCCGEIHGLDRGARAVRSRPSIRSPSRSSFAARASQARPRPNGPAYTLQSHLVSLWCVGNHQFHIAETDHIANRIAVRKRGSELDP
jgi:hypothetical protein